MARGSEQKLEVISTLLTLVTRPEDVARHLSDIRDATLEMQKVKDEAAVVVAKANAVRQTVAKLERDEEKLREDRHALEVDIREHARVVAQHEDRVRVLNSREHALDEREKSIDEEAQHVNTMILQHAEDVLMEQPTEGQA